MGTMSWAYGVTAVPERLKTTLPRTLDSLAKAGFDRPRLFVDGAGNAAEWKALAGARGLEMTTREPRIRTFGNWTLALAELFIREPKAERFALFQDDLVTVLGLREYLERGPYPARGYQNLYTFPSNQLICPKEGGEEREGWFRSNQFGRGAVGLVFDREAVIALLTHEHFVMRPLTVGRGWKAVDGGVVTALNKAGFTEYVHFPSLTYHTGAVSVMGNAPHAQTKCFPGEDWDARSILRGPEPRR
jgi:hypothetical protein